MTKKDKGQDVCPSSSEGDAVALPSSHTKEKSIYLRTSLDERIFAVTGGTELIPITVLPRILPMSYQTIKNQISLGRFPLPIIKLNRKNYVRAEDLAGLIEGSRETGISIRKKCGRKTNEERSNRREALSACCWS